MSSKSEDKLKEEEEEGFRSVKNNSFLTKKYVNKRGTNILLVFMM